MLTSRGGSDAFLARYATEDGRLLAAQRMGGSSDDYWSRVAALRGRVYVAGSSTSTDGDFPAGKVVLDEAGQPTREMSAFVPGSPYNGRFVMRLDAAAPIVHVADTDITVRRTPRSRSPPRASAGTIVWYESGVPCRTRFG